ncbi:ASCH domain-containing protein [Azonexus hydrophilus]|uniref:ASCH domain-containing protein n=1 Tax=Azonexus hydrophilus TaxID=418702 RepID=A0ABZ2XEJ3_9RHOO
MSPAISIRQPWAWLILNAGKDIENRDWPTHFRGRVLIHASKTCTKAEYEDAMDFMTDRQILQGIGMNIPSIKGMDRGGIVGSVEIVDCVTKSDSPWFMGQYGFVLRNLKPMPFIPWKGRLGFFNVPEIKP